MRDVYVVVPDGIDDPARPSGGNTYDRHLCRELGAHGWAAHEHAVAGFWGRPDTASFAALEETLRRIPDDAVVLLDGLIGSTAPEVLVPQASRLRLVVLVHMPLGDRPPDDGARQREGAVLTAAAATLTTSAWTRRRLVALYDLPAHRVGVAEPGAEPAEPARGTGTGEALLCVGAVTFEKGHDILLEALESIAALSWHCTCVGSLDRDPGFVAGLRRRSRAAGLGERVSFPGPRTGADLDRGYASADLLVTGSRAETYGLVVSEALSRGLPVIAAEVGGLGEALGEDAAGARPGLLVAPEDPVALAGALSDWLGDAELRARLRRAAAERRQSLPRWSTTASAVAGVPGGSVCMSAGATRVTPGWLALREPADAEARARDLAADLERAHPASRDPRVIHDFGCGTGAMGRWLAPLLAGPQHWVLHDRDADLLALAAADVPGPAADGARVTVEARHGDIARIHASDLAGATLITASALLDMLTGDELDRLAGLCAGAGCPVLLTLSVVGRVEIAPADPLDRRVAAAFDAHQRRLTERGRLLGPDAVEFAVEAFRRAGAEVLVRPSPWRLGPAHSALAAQVLAGWVGAASEQEVELAGECEPYARRRLEQAGVGELAVTVGHADLLALP